MTSPVRLRLFGGAALESEGGPLAGVVAQRRRLAMLALLAASPTGVVSRGRIADLLFPEAEPARGHKAVADALHAIRRALGRDVVAAVGDALRLDPALLPSDVGAFREAIGQGADERAVACYGGPFLDGLALADAPEFSRWAEETRDELAREHAAALERLARAHEARGDALGAGGWWRRLAALDPYCSRAAVALARALAAAGDPAAALRHLRAHEALLRHDLAVPPPAEVLALADELRARPAPGPPGPAPASLAGSEAAARPATPVEPRPDDPPRAPPARRARWARVGVSGAVASIALLAAVAWSATRQERRFAVATSAAAAGASRDDVGPAVARRPVIAVRLTAPPGADSAGRWLAASVAQMVADALARAAAVEVLPLDHAAARPAVPAGATHLVTGTVAEATQGLVLDGAVREVASGRTLVATTWADGGALDLADRAAAGALGAVRAEGSGLRLSALETASVAAYEHFTRALALLWLDSPDGDRELDRALALDSGFVSALYQRYRRALATNESPATRERLAAALRRALPRATDRDRLEYETFAAYLGGDHARSESLARTLVRRHPHDPRGYDLLADVYSHHGRFAAAESTLLMKVGLARAAGLDPARPCAACPALVRLVTLRFEQGDVAGALAHASRLVAAHPELTLSWVVQAHALSQAGRTDEALASWRGASLLDARSSAVGRVRTLLMGRRLDAAESAVTALLAGARTAADSARALDVRALLERERGRMRASVRTVDEAARRDPSGASLRLMALGALARRIVELRPRGAPTPAPGTGRADDARAWTWHAALAADAAAGVADGAALGQLADSMQRVGQLSYFARDWGLHHHVRGLVHLRAGRPSDAARELERALFGVPGWTRTRVALAEAYLRSGRPDDALRALRPAYTALLDGMARYVPRSELDLHMARAFHARGDADSAAAYLAHVRRAWRDADPELRRELRALEREVTR